MDHMMNEVQAMPLHFDYIVSNNLGVLMVPQHDMETKKQVVEQSIGGIVDPQSSTSYH